MYKDYKGSRGQEQKQSQLDSCQRERHPLIERVANKGNMVQADWEYGWVGLQGQGGGARG